MIYTSKLFCCHIKSNIFLSFLFHTADVMDPVVLTNYTRDLRDVIEAIKEKVPYFALGGPSLFGELPRGQNYRDPYFDYYEEMNRNGTRDGGIKYIETREAFFNNLPYGWPFDIMWLTYDGEHHNGRGEAVIRRMFIEQLASDEWSGLWDESKKRRKR